MASNSKSKRAVDVESKDLTTCCVCFYAFNNGQHKPHSLPCLHTFCVHCLKGMVLKGMNHVTCPKCKRVYQLPGGGAVSDLPTNNFALCILKLLKDRQSCFWCLTCDAVPEPSCHHSLHIVLDRSKDVDELCALLLVDATFSSEVVTLRERLHSNLQLELEGLQEKKEKKAVELLMAENSSCLDKRRLMMQNWAALKWQSPSLIHGFISFKKSLKKAIEEMKEEAIQVEEMLPKHRISGTDVGPSAAAIECVSADDIDTTPIKLEAETDATSEAAADAVNNFNLENEPLLPLSSIFNSSEEEDRRRNEFDSMDENLLGAVALTRPNEEQATSETTAAASAMVHTTLESEGRTTRRRRHRHHPVLAAQVVIPPYGFSVEFLCSSSSPLRCIFIQLNNECINALDFSSDGSLLVSGGADKCVRLWKFRELLDVDGKLRPTRMKTEHGEGGVTCVAVSPNSRHIFSGGRTDKTVLIHDCETAKLMNSVATHFSPDEKYLAASRLSDTPDNSGIIHQISFQSGSDGNIFLPVLFLDTALRIYDARRPANKSVIQFLKRPSSSTSAEFLPVDPNQLVCCQFDGVYVVDIRKPKSFLQCLSSSPTMDDKVSDVRYNCDGSRLLCTSLQSVDVYDLLSNKKLDLAHKIPFSRSSSRNFRFAGKEDELLVSNEDRKLFVWQLPSAGRGQTTSPLMELVGHRCSVSSFSFNKSFGVLASSDANGVIELWVPNNVN